MGFPDSCPICLEKFGPEQRITRTPCRANANQQDHVFHTECLRGWLQRARTCPLCRLDLVEAVATPAAVSSSSLSFSGESGEGAPLDSAEEYLNAYERGEGTIGGG